jgi:hypothetical protein
VKIALLLCSCISVLGAQTLERKVLGSPMRVTVSPRTAGAVASITWRGREFLNAFDHGRELQSALSLDGLGECYNPTEAGSEHDGVGETTSSRLLQARVRGRVLATETDAAFWLAPGQAYPQGCGDRKQFVAAYNRKVRDGYIIRKSVTLGVPGVENAIEYVAEFAIPYQHESATYELATAYMPPDFTAFFTFDPAASKVEALSDGPGEQRLPVILATPDRQFAMGVWSPDEKVTYGRFKFLGNPGTLGWNTVKWNCVFRQRGVRPSAWQGRCYIVLGTVDEVAGGMVALVKAASTQSPGRGAR